MIEPDDSDLPEPGFTRRIASGACFTAKKQLHVMQVGCACVCVASEAKIGGGGQEKGGRTYERVLIRYVLSKSSGLISGKAR
jgi:hypothetical protein